MRAVPNKISFLQKINQKQTHSKSKIKVLQSIGRMLRQHESKEHAVLYDIVDDLSIKSHKNYTLKHFEERLKIYNSEKFDHKVYNVRI